MPSTLKAVLVVDDDVAVGKVLAALLVQDGYEAHHVTSGAEALRRLDAFPYDVVLSDVRMPGMTGVELLRVLSGKWPDVPVVLLTAHASVPLAVEAMKAGAHDFLTKPFAREEVSFVVRKACALRVAPRPAASAPAGMAGMLGSSSAMNQTLATVKKLARATTTVLIRGETGTGKELVAKALHFESERKHAAFVRVHCAALAEALLESELFGHEKGAFTGATSRKQGRVELAHGGTLFLDEIGEISQTVQVKLLRVLQERVFERVGGTESVRVDVRVVAATHRDLEAMVKAGQFREDLFYRLNVVQVVVPPLRARDDDAVLLAQHFARVFGEANGVPKVTFVPDALEVLRAHPWPGNVRQLENLVERLVVLADGATITRADVLAGLGGAPAVLTTEGAGTLSDTRRDAEREALVAALAKAKNNRTLAARLLGVSRRTLYNKLREHAIDD